MDYDQNLTQSGNKSMPCFGGIGTHLHVYVAPTIPRCFSVCEATLWAWEELDGLNTGQPGRNTCNQSLETILQVLGSRYVYLDQDIPCGEYPISQPILWGKKTWVAVYWACQDPGVLDRQLCMCGKQCQEKQQEEEMKSYTKGLESQGYLLNLALGNGNLKQDDPFNKYL